MRRLFIVCLSLANLCYLRIWEELLVLRPEDVFYAKHPPRPAQYLAAISDVSLLAILFFLVSVSIRKARGWMRPIWHLVLIAVIANSIRGMLSSRVPLLRGGLFQIVSPTGALLLALAFFAGLCYILFRFSAQVVRVGATIAAVLAPFVILTFGESTWRATHYRWDDTGEKAAASRLAATPGRRVVWIIFDELDYRLSFVARPPSIRMPNFDRLCAHAMCASNAYPPSDATSVSMPALIYGRELRSERTVSSRILQLNFLDGTASTFGSPPNVFS
jgi:hypothetical protein